MKIYLCGTDWQHELEAVPVVVYSSMDLLKKNCKCWKECGIVELKIESVSWINPADFFNKEKI